MLSTDSQRALSVAVGLPRGPKNAVISKTQAVIDPREAVRPGPLQHIWIITGPAGSGKSTVAKGLQEELQLPFLEGDDVSGAASPDSCSPWRKATHSPPNSSSIRSRTRTRWATASP
jgi:Cytidylate kinase